MVVVGVDVEERGKRERQGGNGGKREEREKEGRGRIEQGDDCRLG